MACDAEMIAVCGQGPVKDCGCYTYWHGGFGDDACVHKYTCDAHEAVEKVERLEKRVKELTNDQ